MLNPEHLLIPYAVSPLPAGPWLVFAPHADDETFGMGGTLLKAREQALETHVIVMTDGALGGDTQDLVEIRRKEVQKACELLGVRSLQCWTEPDRGLHISERLLLKLVQAIHDLAPSAVFFPAALELHPDHRATAKLVWAALQSMQGKQGKVGMPTAYAYEITVQSPINTLIDISAQISAKEQVMLTYASQNSQNPYPALVKALNLARALTLPPTVSHAEGFYKFAVEDFAQELHEITRRVIDLYN